MQRLAPILASALAALLSIAAVAQDTPAPDPSAQDAPARDASAQDPPARGDDEVPQRHGIFLDSIDVRVNNVEVVVTDDRGRSVTGLNRHDFRVFEDGEEMEITNFYAIEGGVRADAAALREGDRGTAPAPVPVHVAIVVDDAHLTPEGRELVFQRLQENLDRFIVPRAEIMVVHKDAALEVVQPFTDDLGAVNQALEGLRGQVGSAAADRLAQRRILRLIEFGEAPDAVARGLVTGSLPSDAALQEADALLSEVEHYAQEQDQRIRNTVATLGRLVNAMAGLPGRKAVFYVADQLSLQPARLAYRVWESKYGQYLATTGIGSVESELFRQDASVYLQELVANASASGVVFYAVGAPEEPAQTALSAAQGGTGFLVRDVAAEMEMMNEEGMRLLARGTGGRVATQGSQVADLLGRVASDFQTYYSLGYVSPDPRDGERHQVRVEVSRPDLEVRYLESYRDKSEGQVMVDKLLAALLLGAGHNPMGISVDVGEPRKAGRKRYDLPVLVRFPLREVTLIPRADEHVGSVAVYLLVRGDDGGTSEPAAIRVPVKVARSALKEMMGQEGAYPAQLKVAAGRQTIAIGVRDEVSGTESFHRVVVEVGGK